MSCPRCMPIAELNAKLNEELAVQRAIAIREARRSNALTQQLRVAHEEDQSSVEIRRLLSEWQKLLGHPKAKIHAGGKRWQTAKGALRHHSFDECLEAIQGLALFPYVVNATRSPSGDPKQRYDGVEHALRDETVIERMRKEKRRAGEASFFDLEEVWYAVRATADFYGQVAVAAARREQAEREAPNGAAET